MTAAASAPRTAPAPDPRSGGHGFVGTWTLTRFLLRRDRVRIPGWAVGFAVFVGYLVAALPTVYGGETELQAVSQLFRDPVGRLMVGPGYGLGDPTLERFVANGYGCTSWPWPRS